MINYTHLMASFLLSILLGSSFYTIAMDVTQPALMTSSEIVKKLVEIEMKLREEELQGKEGEMVRKSREREGWDAKKFREKEFKEISETYLNFEENLQVISENYPRYEVAGNLDYFMSLEELENKIREKFRAIYENGQILTEEQFNELDRSNWADNGVKLTRIWGAEYLEKRFKKDQRDHMKVPHYIIVVKSLDDIQLKLTWGSCWPILASIVNGTIYSKKIVGTDATKTIKIGQGYTDYDGVGNILKTADGSYYIIDTEYKSFYDDIPDDHLMKSIRKLGFFPLWLCEYLRRRFMLRNNLGTEDIDGGSQLISLKLD